MPELPLGKRYRLRPGFAVIIRTHNHQVSRMPQNVDGVPCDKRSCVHEGKIRPVFPCIPVVVRCKHFSLPSPLALSALILGSRHICHGRPAQIYRRYETPVPATCDSGTVTVKAFIVGGGVKNGIFLSQRTGHGLSYLKRPFILEVPRGNC